MSGITGQGTTYNLPNYTGELFGVTPQDTPLLSSIGGLTGGEEANGVTSHQWQTYDLRDAEDDRQALEGADAPDAEERVRANVRNVLEIHHEALEVSYTKQAAINQVAASGSNHPFAGSSVGTNPVTDELAWQTTIALQQVARDVEVSFITGTFQDPANNSTARKTRGLIEAISTNEVTSSSDLEEDLLDAMQLAYDNGGLMVEDTRTLVLGSTQKRVLTRAFLDVNDSGFRQQDRNVGGVNVQTIETDFGRCNVMLDRHVPDDTVLILSLEQLAPVFLPIPGKGHFFREELAKVGSATSFQLYGEIGLRYGNELGHAKITGLPTGS